MGGWGCGGTGQVGPGMANWLEHVGYCLPFSQLGEEGSFTRLWGLLQVAQTGLDAGLPVHPRPPSARNQAGGLVAQEGTRDGEALQPTWSG